MSSFFSLLLSLLGATLRLSTPLILAALGGVFSERAGVVNIGLEGIIVVGAFFSIAVTASTGNPYLGMLAGVLAGVLVSLIHAVLAISLKADQVISGTAINLFASGLAGFLIYQIFKTHGQTDSVKATIPYPTKILSGIPVIGGFLSELNWLVFVAIILVFVSHYVLYKTPLGLRIRSVGEHPKAADTVGINVYGIRYLCVLLSGALAGLGGVYISLISIGRYYDGMSAGKGFIALAAMIFGNWKPFGAMWACFLFGLAQAFQINAQTFGLHLPIQFWASLPYILTMLALAGFVGKTQAPLEDGVPYEKGSR